MAAQMGASVGVWIYSLLGRSLNHQLRLNVSKSRLVVQDNVSKSRMVMHVNVSNN